MKLKPGCIGIAVTTMLFLAVIGFEIYINGR
jgi:hypothetical protein